MEALFPAVLGLLLIGGIVTYVALRVARRGDPDRPEGAAGSDPSPAGDTSEHAGHGASDDPASSAPGGAGEPAAAEPGGAEPGGAGAEGEREPRREGGDAEPRFSSESERLANREP